MAAQWIPCRIDAKHGNAGHSKSSGNRKQIFNPVQSGFVYPDHHLNNRQVENIPRSREGVFGNGYEQKRVEVFYTMEDDTIVTVTVYVFYGKWS